MARRKACSVGLLLAVLVPRAAQAYEAEVSASVDAQFYTLRSPYGDPIVRRRRYTQTLGVSVYGVQGDYVPNGPELSFRARMRLDSDFGQRDEERDPAQTSLFVPALQQSPLDLMYAYLEGRNYLDGYLGFRIGRQYTTDALGFWSFDGALVTLTTPVFMRAEVFGGFEQRGGLPLSTPRWEADGVYRGDRSNLDFNRWPSFLRESKLAPAYGFALESSGVHWLATRFSYRKVITRDTVLVSPFADTGNGFTTLGGARVSSERIGYSLRVSEPGLGALGGSVVYDLYNQLFSEYLATLDFYASNELELGAEYEYYLPTFDADSIWNWFSHRGSQTALGRGSWKAMRALDLSASAGVRIFETEGKPGTYDDTGNANETGRLSDLLATLSGRQRWADGSVTLRGLLETGKRGHRSGADVTTAQAFEGGLYDAMLILSLYDWHDDSRPDRDATSFSYVLGGGVRPFERTRMGLEWEHSVNQLVGQRFRVLATLDLTVLQ
jgi:hypothetical protein